MTLTREDGEANVRLALATTRNLLAHDYPTNPAAQAQRANLAWRDLPALIDGTRTTLNLLRTEGHLP